LIPQTKRAELQLQFPATLDTTHQRSLRDTSAIAKVLLLTSRHFVLTDSQLIDNGGLRKLFQNEEFRQCLDEASSPDSRPVIACMRGKEGFEAVLKAWFIEREKPQVLGSLSRAQNQEVQNVYKRGGRRKPKTLGHFYDICRKAGEDFPSYLEELERIFPASARFQSTWPKGDYHQAVSLTLAGRREGLAKHFAVLSRSGAPGVDRARIMAELQLCDGLIEALADKKGVDRGYCWAIIDSSAAPAPVKELLRREVLENIYNARFSDCNECDLIRGDEFGRDTFIEGAPELAAKIEKLEAEDFAELEVFPMVVDKIPFKAISNIRKTNNFDICMKQLNSPNVEERVKFLPEYMQFLFGSFSRVPSDSAKLKLKIKRYVLDEKQQSDFAAGGVSGDSALTWMTKGGSWLIQQISKSPYTGPVGKILAFTIEKYFEGRRKNQRNLFKHTLALRAFTPERSRGNQT
jgi:hypothetical protein